jgi:hypothetical protein
VSWPAVGELLARGRRRGRTAGRRPGAALAAEVAALAELLARDRRRGRTAGPRSASWPWSASCWAAVQARSWAAELAAVGELLAAVGELLAAVQARS